ncbi:phosphohydrolase [Thiomicrospira aerophila AL3]|uniref:Phosphohydrolase n=2 Tax=Thiomicrospira aerophila TaxID=92245 RepID=W0DTN5_9GAMM|nr:phosphohydrolase [Thiomicrospira aerophila AL3]
MPLNESMQFEWRRALIKLLQLNLVFLLLAIIGNLLFDRLLLAAVHTLALVILTVLLWAARETELSRIEHAYLLTMFIYFFSFFWLKLEAFDLIWLTLFPAMAAFVVQTNKRLLQWLVSFQAGLLAVLVIVSQQWLGLAYSPFLVGNLMFASIFISMLAWYNFNYKTKLIAAQQAFNSHLELRVAEATQTIAQLNQDLEASQRDVVLRLGEICEVRSKETGQHVQRVSEYSRFLAGLYGLDATDINLLHDAAPLHDVGKVAIPDAILNKPGRYTDAEFAIMREHANIGYNLLKTSNQPLLKMAAIIARDHHEWWNGQGYPNQLTGENISIYGRIVAIADVFDALSFERVYKPAWSDEKIYSYFEQHLGTQFDPTLCQLFLDYYAEFIKLRNKFSQEPAQKSKKAA